MVGKKSDIKHISVPLTIYLLTEDCRNDNLDMYINQFNEGNIILKKDNYVLYKRVGNKDYPKWLKDFNEKVLNIDIDKMFSKSISEGLTLIKEVEYDGAIHIFAINFGQGWHNINKNKIESTFGIYVAQKMLLEGRGRVKIAQSRSIEGDPINKSRMFANELEHESLFTLINSGEALRELNLLASPNATDISSIIGKYGPLNVKCKFRKDEIPCINYIDRKLEILLREYKSIKNDEVALLFKGLQLIDKKKSENLFNELCKKLFKKDGDAVVFLFEPEMNFDFMRVSSIKYEIAGIEGKDGSLYEKLDLNHYLMKKNEITIDDLRNDFVLLLDEDGNVAKKWSILEMLYGELKDGQSVFILSNMIWHKVDLNKYNKINKTIDAIIDKDFKLKNEVKISTENLINTRRNNIDPLKSKIIPRESIFNEEFARVYGYILLDKKLIKIEGDPIEVCDIYNPSKNEFIHVKVGTAADKLSHLFSQGYASARALKMNSVEYLNEVNAILKDIDMAEICNNRFDTIINFMIINPRKVNKLTFLSKMSLIEKIENLQAFGFKIKLTWINDLNIY